MRILAFPFGLTTGGVVATVESGSDAEVDQAIAVLLLTNHGERPMAPQFGIPDPAFAGLNLSDVQVGLDQYGPGGVRIAELDTVPVNDTQSEATLKWRWANSEGTA